MRRMLLMVLFAFMGAGVCSAQQAPQTQPSTESDVIACPASQIPAAYRGYKTWDRDHVRVSPVIPELYMADLRMLARYFKGPSPEDTGLLRRNLLAGNARMKMLLAQEAYTPPDTNLADAPLEPPKDFWDQVLASSWHFNTIPCGETVMNYLSQGAEDEVLPNGTVLFRARSTPGPWMLNWCERGVTTADGKCAVWVAESDPIEIKSGPNYSSSYKTTVVIRIIIRCGNPDIPLDKRQITLVDNPDTTAPLVQTSTPVAPPPPPAPVAAAVPTPPAQAEAAPYVAPKTPRHWPLISAGIAADFCKVRSDYSGVVAPGNPGDAPTWNSCFALWPNARVESTDTNWGYLVEGGGRILGKTGTKFFDDPVRKNRDRDLTTDDRWEILGGVKIPHRALALYLGYHNFRINEHYFAQGAETYTIRQYQGPMVGVVGIFNPLFRVRVGYGRVKRTAWTQQYYPGVNFPRATRPNENGWDLNFRPELDTPTFYHLYGWGAYDLLWIHSRRNNTFARDESVKNHSFLLGVGIRFGG